MAEVRHGPAFDDTDRRPNAFAAREPVSSVTVSLVATGPSIGAWSHSGGKYVQTRDLLKVSKIERGDRVIFFDCRGADQEIVDWYCDSFACLLAADRCCNLGRYIGDGVNGDVPFQFVNERPAALSSLTRVGSGHPMHKLGHCDWRHHNLNPAKAAPDFR